MRPLGRRQYFKHNLIAMKLRLSGGPWAVGALGPAQPKTFHIKGIIDHTVYDTTLRRT